MKHPFVLPPRILKLGWAFLLLIFGCGLSLYGQTGGPKRELIMLSAKSDSLTKKLAAEKLYLQFDKPYYASGDTIWFKAYLLDAAYLTASAKSGIMYIDIANDSNKVVKQYRFLVQSGLAWGNIALSSGDFNTGTYTLRAYTSWMRNEGDAAFFFHRFYISSAGENNLLVNTRFHPAVVNGINSVEGKLLFSDMDKKPLAVQGLQLQVMSGSKSLYRQKMQTGVDGVLNVNFKLPEKPEPLAVIAESETKDKRAVVPVILNRPENTDVQFLPEGGNLVAGLPAHIGFKAIGEDGNGVQVSGIIVDHEQKQVAAFQSLHNGMGSFDLPAQNGASYMAKVTLPGGMVKEYPLPAAKASGTILQVRNAMDSDSLEVIGGVSNDIAQADGNYFLIGKARGIVCYAAIISFREGNVVRRKIAKSLFPTGITHFTLMNIKVQPLNERLVFINHHDNLDIQVNPDKASYGARDSIALRIKVTDSQGRPVAGNFSMAVTADGQVKNDTLAGDNILNRFLLTSDLKGFVEGPDYYFQPHSPAAWRALDNLLLTQGWVGYDWQQTLNTPDMQFAAEKDFSVSGSVNNVFNKPVKNTHVLLFSKSPFIITDTLTDFAGDFRFRNFPPIDTPIFILKAVNKNGKSFNVNIKVNDRPAPPFAARPFPAIMPWYVNSDTTMLNYTKNNAAFKQDEYYRGTGKLLKEVKISARKIINNSQNVNGPGNADIVMDEKEMEAAGKKTWLDLFKERIPGFHEAIRQAIVHKTVHTAGLAVDVPTTTTIDWYYIKDQQAVFVIDGIQLDSVIHMTFIDLIAYLKFHNAEEIKGMEVSYSSKYISNYVKRYIYDNTYTTTLVPDVDYAYVEITTRSGDGPFLNSTPGLYLYKPLPFSKPALFYKPRYTAAGRGKETTDRRSTIDWEPNITTNKNGEAVISFFSSDSKDIAYTIVINGSDMNGGLGYKSAAIHLTP